MCDRLTLCRLTNHNVKQPSARCNQMSLTFVNHIKNSVVVKESSKNELSWPFISSQLNYIYMDKIKVLWEGHIILPNPHNRFDVYITSVKSKMEISQDFVAFSEYLNFTELLDTQTNLPIFSIIYLGTVSWHRVWDFLEEYKRCDQVLLWLHISWESEFWPFLIPNWARGLRPMTK